MAEYNAFSESGLNALLSAIKAVRVKADELSSASSAASSDIQELAAQMVSVLADVEGCLNQLNQVKADTEAVENALAAKQDKLTFDSAPKSGSSNPVTSGGVYTAINSGIGAANVYATAEVV